MLAHTTKEPESLEVRTLLPSLLLLSSEIVSEIICESRDIEVVCVVINLNASRKWCGRDIEARKHCLE